MLAKPGPACLRSPAPVKPHREDGVWGGGHGRGMLKPLVPHVTNGDWSMGPYSPFVPGLATLVHTSGGCTNGASRMEAPGPQTVASTISHPCGLSLLPHFISCPASQAHCPHTTLSLWLWFRGTQAKTCSVRGKHSQKQREVTKDRSFLWLMTAPVSPQCCSHSFNKCPHAYLDRVLC